MDILTWIGTLVLLSIIATFAWGGLLAAPWLPMRKRDLRRLVEVVQFTENDVVVDLGCGDGRIMRYLGNKTRATIHGYEVAILPFLWSYITIVVSGLRKRVHIHYKNFFKTNFTNATVVIFFLTPGAMPRLLSDVFPKLPPGCRVISYAFKIPGWTPDIIDKPSERDIALYVYTKKE